MGMVKTPVNSPRSGLQRTRNGFDRAVFAV